LHNFTPPEPFKKQPSKSELKEAECLAGMTIYEKAKEREIRAKQRRSSREQEKEFFDGDPFPQGLKKNRHDLDTMSQFAKEQELLAQPLTVEELFTENTENT
jgi:hypothetical protein